LAKTKTKKFRGSMTHGRGKKAGRGAGLRGGRGNAGLMKHRWMYMTKNMPDHFGRRGFKRPQSIVKKDKIINVGQIEEMFPGQKEIDLGKEGYDKLLSGGRLNTKIKITVNTASEKAIEKVKKQGGEVILPKKEVVEPPVEKTEDVIEPVEEPSKEE
jgi:large subunit ribosomal protein L15